MISSFVHGDESEQQKRRRRLIVIAIVGSVSLVVAAWLVTQISEVVILFIVSLLIFYLVDPLVIAAERLFRVNRLGAIVMFYAGCLIFGILGIMFLLPLVIDQFNNAYDLLNSEDVRSDLLQRIQFLLDEYLSFLPTDDLNQRVTDFGTAAISDVATFLLGLLSLLSMSIVVPFILFFLLKDGAGMRKKLVSSVPNRFFELSLNLLDTIDRHLGTYIRGQLMVAGSVGSLSTIALWILGVPYFFVIGMMAGLANLIPYLGPVAGMVPAVGISIVFFDELAPLWGTGYNALWEPLIAVVVAFAMIQLIDNVALSPFIVSKSTDLHPLTVLITVIAGGRMFGMIGLLLGVPVVSIVKVVTRDIIWHFRHYRLL